MTLHAPIAKTAAETALAETFAKLAKSGDAKAAFADFEKRGLPSRRDEAWHYTDLRAATKQVFPLAATPDAGRLKAAEAAAKAPKIGAARVTLVDGRYVEALSDRLPEGVSLSVRRTRRSRSFRTLSSHLTALSSKAR